MRQHLLTVLVTLTFLSLLAAGALWLVHWRHGYSPKTYLVLDAQSLEPISGTEICIPKQYILFGPYFLNYFQPDGDSGQTNENGLVTLRVASELAGSPMVIAPAGYSVCESLPESQRLLAPHVDRVIFLEHDK